MPTLRSKVLRPKSTSQTRPTGGAASSARLTVLKKWFGLSRSSLYNLFKPLGGVSGYIQHRRLFRAHALLLAAPHGVNVTTVALKLGFKHASHFTRAFREKFGYNPSVVREACLLPSDKFSTAAADCVDRSYENWVRELR